MSFTLTPRKDLSYVGLDLRWVVENGRFWLNIGQEADCRRHADERCVELSLEIPEGEYNPICEEACDLLVKKIPQVCSDDTWKKRSDDVDLCMEVCRDDADWTWNFVECLEQEVFNGSCLMDDKCRSISFW